MSSSNNSNAWLKAKKKTELTEIADKIGLKSYKDLKKSDLEAALDDFIAQHSSRFSSNSELAGYFASRSRTLTSPIKKEKETIKEEAEKGLKVVKRRVTKAAEEIAAEANSSAVLRTPARSLSQVASRVPLPASPADIAFAVDRSTVALRKRAASIYQESGITEASNATRETLSTVTSVLFSVAAFELYYIRPAILANRFAFTIPAISAIGTDDFNVYLPDMFLLLTSSFWSPALTWVFTSILVPSIFGYFFNISANSHSGPRTRARALNETVVDPLTFSIVKALLAYVVYAQGVTFGGLLSEFSVARLNNAVYGGYQGILVGTAITGLVAIYDAALKR
ncbi:hypothetical protein LEL_03194 [Akanthomyces lecanii RCEF 1005]|uniref:Rho termination factor N-terminal domain-containing protein n=1 Tax=Akanthomyces lecanii RCEF 1005 TaxID=1081108 RepID=A0A162KTQ6_CORDF|nr:hypothetical protein LEL_03194 [Akanthomyces lecanii RCEF 1005]